MSTLQNRIVVQSYDGIGLCIGSIVDFMCAVIYNEEVRAEKLNFFLA